jgi:hypothetical protein
MPLAKKSGPSQNRTTTMRIFNPSGIFHPCNFVVELQLEVQPMFHLESTLLTELFT